jgi:hypothetical protein
MVVVLLAGLTVTSPPELGCADRPVIVERLRASGVTTEERTDVRVRFFAEGNKRVAEIGAGSAATRRIEHQGNDCALLTDATVALLSVLLDEIESARGEAAAPQAASPPPTEPLLPSLRLEAGSVGSKGIVADVAVGITAGLAWRPARWVSLGLSGEIWPARDSSVREGSVSVSAWMLGLALCAGHRWPAIALEGCASPYGGRYALSAEGFPVVRSENRGVFGAELAGRIAIPIAGSLALFLRAGVWVPVTRLEMTVRGADTGFATTSAGPKAATGLEIAL